MHHARARMWRPLWLAMVLPWAAATAIAQAGPEVDDAALDALRATLGYTTPAADPVVVRALRQVRDPELRGVFEDLTGRDDPRVRLQAQLGLAELNTPPQLGLSTLAATDRPGGTSERALLISAGLDDGLIDPRDAQVMLGWPALDPGVKLLLAVDLLRRGDNLGEQSWLHTVLDGPEPTRNAVAALLLHEAGDPAGSAALQTLADQTGVEPRSVAAVLQTIVSAGLSDGGGFALTVAAQTDNAALGELALRTALGTGTPGAGTVWRRRYDAATETSERTRWALIALRALPGAPQAVFETMAGDADPLVAAIGAAGRSVSADDPGTAETLRRLYGFDHPVCSSWLVRFARQDARPALAGAIVGFIVSDYEPGRPETRDRRLEEVMLATELWADTDPVAARVELLAAFDRPHDPLWAEAVCLGLLRCGTEEAAAVADEIPTADTANVRMLRALLLARYATPLPDEVRDDLGLAVRGAGDFDTTLRAQAAWLLVRHGGLAERLRSAASSP